MYYFILLSLLLLFPYTLEGHYEDIEGCDAMVTRIVGTDFTSKYSGVSEDGRDYIYRAQEKGASLIVEAHFILVPHNQWRDQTVPEYFPPILSLWLDYDGDGHYGEWYLFPRLHTDCTDALHFIWDADRQSYRLYAVGKEKP